MSSPSQSTQSKSTILVTGATDGIGLTTAKHVAAKGYDVLIHGRNEQRIQRAADIVRSFASDRNSKAQVWTLPAADISTVEGCDQLANDVKSVCEQHQLELCVLLNNAGVFSQDLIRTKDGYELTFAVNVLATFAITSRLLPLLLQTPRKKRIVIASSISQEESSFSSWDDLHYLKRSYSAHSSYSDSKLLDAMLSMEFAARLQDAGYGTDRITCNCLDPGTVNTKMLLDGWGRIGIDVEDALYEAWLCTSDDVKDDTGKYFVENSSCRASSPAYNQGERDILWKLLNDADPKGADMWNFKFCSK